MPSELIALDRRSARQLEEYAKSHGMTVEDAAAELACAELRRRTNTKDCKGAIKPFRRR